MVLRLRRQGLHNGRLQGARGARRRYAGNGRRGRPGLFIDGLLAVTDFIAVCLPNPLIVTWGGPAQIDAAGADTGLGREVDDPGGCHRVRGRHHHVALHAAAVAPFVDRDHRKVIGGIHFEARDRERFGAPRAARSGQACYRRGRSEVAVIDRGRAVTQLIGLGRSQGGVVARGSPAQAHGGRAHRLTAGIRRFEVDDAARRFVACARQRQIGECRNVADRIQRAQRDIVVGFGRKAGDSDRLGAARRCRCRCRHRRGRVPVALLDRGGRDAHVVPCGLPRQAVVARRGEGDRKPAPGVFVGEGFQIADGSRRHIVGGGHARIVGNSARSAARIHGADGEVIGGQAAQSRHREMLALAGACRGGRAVDGDCGVPVVGVDARVRHAHFVAVSLSFVPLVARGCPCERDAVGEHFRGRQIGDDPRRQAGHHDARAIGGGARQTLVVAGLDGEATVAAGGELRDFHALECARRLGRRGTGRGVRGREVVVVDRGLSHPHIVGVGAPNRQVVPGCGPLQAYGRAHGSVLQDHELRERRIVGARPGGTSFHDQAHLLGFDRSERPSLPARFGRHPGFTGHGPPGPGRVGAYFEAHVDRE